MKIIFILIICLKFFSILDDKYIFCLLYTSLGELGVDTVVEIGPGRTLSGFVKKTVKGIKCYPVETAEELQAAVAALRGE